MDIEEIRAVVVIAQLGGFYPGGRSIASLTTGDEPPNGLIEQELGASLPQRDRSGISLTEAGRAFLAFAKAVEWWR